MVGARPRILFAAAASTLLAAMVGCTAPDDGARAPNMFDRLLATDFSAKRPIPTEVGPGAVPDVPPAQIYRGEPERAAPRGGVPSPGTVAAATKTGDGYDLNFENADIAAISKVLLGDVLGQAFAVDPRVKGAISLSSGRPIAKADVLPLFEGALKMVNAAVVKEGAVYRVIPRGEAIGGGATDRGGVEPGYGISVLPLRYVSSQAVLKVVESFAARPGTVRVDKGRNLLVVQGTSNERASVIDAALALDVDWMKGQSVGVFPIRNASAETIIAELENILDTKAGGSGETLIRLQPVARLNAVLAVAKRPDQIAFVQSWVARLDRADAGNTALRVYKLRFGNAKVMAGLLNEIFTGRTATPGTSDLAQLTPGGGVVTTPTTPSTPSTTTTATRPPVGTTPTTPPGGTRFISDDDDTPATRPDAATAPSPSLGPSGPAPFPNVRITADVANNSLLIYASREEYRMVERAIRDLDKAPLQVAIDATIAEVTLQNDLQYGVQFYVSGDRRTGPGSVGFGEKDVLSRLIPGFNLVLGSEQSPRIVIDALRTLTDVKVLSSPSLVVLDNQPASLQVGDQVPVATRSAQSLDTVTAPIVNTIEFRDTGVILRVTPRVNANGVISLQVEQEISNVVKKTTEETLTPTISQRKIQSTIAVASGQTVLLGGLISERQESARSALPVPVLGDLFGRTTNGGTRTELIIFIRPQIIRDGFDAQLVVDEIRSKISILGGRPPALSAPGVVKR